VGFRVSDSTVFGDSGKKGRKRGILGISEKRDFGKKGILEKRGFWKKGDFGKKGEISKNKKLFTEPPAFSTELVGPTRRLRPLLALCLT
jgi:hypothetical protein